uniref:Uncharacterized protein n=1 Tax=Anguilla anguilla TaxID=7936 RepID=A0A0E9QJD9_ANGAN
MSDDHEIFHRPVLHLKLSMYPTFLCFPVIYLVH